MIELNQSWAGPYHRMPLELPKDRAAMIAKAIEADDGACSTGAMMADPAPVAAKPSLLDELAEAGHNARKEAQKYAWVPWSECSDSYRQRLREQALSVARRLLEREATDAEVNAFVKEYQLFDGSAFESQRAGLKASRRAQLAELEGEVPT